MEKKIIRKYTKKNREEFFPSYFLFFPVRAIIRIYKWWELTHIIKALREERQEIKKKKKKHFGAKRIFAHFLVEHRTGPEKHCITWSFLTSYPAKSNSQQ